MNTQETLNKIYDYWNQHTLGLQYATDKSIEPGTKEFFDHIRPWMNPFKFDWIMRRIDSEAHNIGSGHLLEIGCGMGYDSLEFLKRGIRVTATDLTKNAVEMTKKHFAIENVKAEDIRVETALGLSFKNETFDAVWANGVLHASGDTQKAIDEVYRVLKPGGRAIISHFYRKPSWMYLLKQIPGVNIEFDEEDPPVNQFYTEREIMEMFRAFKIERVFREHEQLLPVNRRGIKAFLYNSVLKPVYNNLPARIKKRFAYKFSVIAIKN